jgi:hypothetical protein
MRWRSPQAGKKRAVAHRRIGSAASKKTDLTDAANARRSAVEHL